MSVAVVSNPPSSIHSGVALRHKYTIQHKSDILLQEQINKVKETQDGLNKLLTQLEIARSPKEVSSLQAQVDRLREKTEYEVLKLQVSNKISCELAHTRADLGKALQGRGDIPACRKRISWLEGRMERVIGKQRFHRQTSFETSGVSSIDNSVIVKNQKCKEDESEAVNHEIIDSGKGMSLKKTQTDLDEELCSPDPQGYETSGVFLTAQPDNTPSDRSASNETSDTEFQTDSDTTRLIHSAPAGQSDHLALVKSQNASGDQPMAVRDIKTEQNGTKKQRVRLVTDDHPQTDSLTGDAAQMYWDSEHHRFECNDISRALCDADPLSYHQMALAIPGSFLSKSETDLGALPWRRHRKGSDIQDVHKIALNKLVARLNNMSEKVYNAAMLSVRSNTKPAMRTERSFVHTTDTSSKHSQDDAKPSELISQQSMEGTTLPKLQLKRLGTSGGTVFYPNPIPPPQKLPLTRTNRQVEFPRLSSYYCDTEDDDRRPAERIVDQHNLYEETKFTLYHEPPRGDLDGPSMTERRLRKLLESDGTQTTSTSAKTGFSQDSVKPSIQELSRKRSPRIKTPLSPEEISKRRRQKIRSHFFVAKAVAKLKGIASSDSVDIKSQSRTHNNKWSLLKPKGNGMEHSGLKWERVKTLVHVNLVSERVDERIDAAKGLGVLRCCDAMVFYALKERLQIDPEKRVQYEAAKSLVLIGCWEDEVLELILQYLVTGNTDIRSDLINAMIDGKNLQYIDKRIENFPSLVKVLSHYCRNPDPADPISFGAAVLLGKMCVVDKHASDRLKTVLHQQSDTHHKAKALEILIKQMNCTDWEIVEELLELMRTSPVWKYRDLAARLLILLGTKHVCVDGKVDNVYELLEKKLWDDPITEVRLSVAKAITALNLFPRASERVEKRLEDADENCRAQAIISLGTLGMKGEKIIRQLLEMIELDPSEYVRVIIVRTFGILKCSDKRIIRLLKEKERVEGALAGEAKKVLAVLCPKTASLKSKSSRSI